MKIMYPSAVTTYDKSSNMKVQKGNAYNNTSEKSLIYSKTYLGGELKYFLMTLNNGELLFF